MRAIRLVGRCSISSAKWRAPNKLPKRWRNASGLKGKAAAIGGSAAERPLLHALSANGIVKSINHPRATNILYHTSNTNCTYIRLTSHTQPWPPSDPQQGASSLLRFSTPDPLSSRRSAASPPQSTSPQPSQQHHQNLDPPPSSPTVSMPVLHSATLLAAK